MSNLAGEYQPGDVVLGMFTTVNTSGAPTQLAGTPSLAVYKDASTTESTTGVSLTIDVDGRTGMNGYTVDTSTDATFYSDGGQFNIVIVAGTVGGTSVVGYVVARFRVIRRPSIVKGVASGTPTTTNIPTSSLTPAVTVADQLKGRVVVFDYDTTTAALRGQATLISASSNAGVLTVDALTTAPVSGDRFQVV